MPLILLITSLFVGIALAALALYSGYWLVYRVTFLHNPVFIPCPDDKLATLITLAKIQPGAKVVDLGSGDGKIVLALAERRIAATGVEINPLLVRRAKRAARQRGLSSRATFIRKSFWKLDFGDYDVITMYGTSYIMPKLGKKLRAEMKKDARFISVHFQFSGWQPVDEANDVRVYQR